MAATKPRWVGAVRRSPSFFSLSWSARGVGASRRGDHKDPIGTGKAVHKPTSRQRNRTTVVGLPEFDRVAFGIGFWSGARDLNPGPHGPDPYVRSHSISGVGRSGQGHRGLVRAWLFRAKLARRRSGSACAAVLTLPRVN